MVGKDGDKKRRRGEPFPDRSLERSPEPSARTSRKNVGRGRLRGFIFVLGLLGATAWFAPWILTRAPIRNRLLAWYLPDLASRIQIGDLHAGWNKPLVIDNVRLNDAAGQAILECPRVATDRTLLDYLRGTSDLGTIQLEQPSGRVVLTREGTNLDEVIAKAPAPAEGNASRPLPAVRVKITNGSLAIHDELLGQDTSLKDVQILAGISAESLPTITLTAAVRAATGEEEGNLALDASCQLPASLTPQDLGNGKVTYTCQDFPWVALQPLLVRWQPDLTLRGAVTGTLESGWKSDVGAPVLHTKGDLRWDRALVRSPSLLGPDVLDEPSLKLDLDAWVEGDRLRLVTCAIDSQMLQATFTLDGPLNPLFTGRYLDILMDTSTAQKFEARGKADVARIAGSFRHLLRLRDGMELDRGHVDFQCVAESVEGMRVIRGEISNDGIQGHAGTQQLAWDEPTELRWDLSATPDGWQLRELEGTASFAKVQGSGNLAEGKFAAEADLARLWERVGQFCELGDTQLAGNWACQGSWRTAEQGIEFQGDGTAENFRMATGARLWEEKQLTLKGRAEARLSGRTLEQLQAADVSLISGADEFHAQLVSPVDRPTSSTRIPLKGQLRGELSSWRSRIEPFVRFDTVRCEGTVVSEFAGEFAATHVHLSPCKVELVNLRLESPTLLINEPRVVVDSDLEWDRSLDAVLIPKATLTSASLAVRAQDVRLVGLASPTEVSGSIAFRGDAGKIVSWMAVKNHWTTVPQGALEGSIRLTHAQGASSYQATIAAKSCSLWQWSPPAPGAPGNQGWQVLWEEPFLNSDVEGKIAWNEGKLTLEPLKIRGEALELATQGDIFMSDWRVALEGDLGYDLRLLCQRFPTLLGPQIELEGKQKQRFRLRGPLFSASGNGGGPGLVSNDLSGEMGLGWERMSAYGLVLGPQQMNAKLERGQISTTPLQTSIAGGQVRVAPRIDLNQVPLAVVLEPPTQVQGIQVTPELVRAWLKYVAPIMADATTVQGRMSMELSGAKIPLAAPKMASVAGRLILEEATLEPGPFAQQIVSTLDGVSVLANRANPLGKLAQPGQRWLTVPRQQVDFQMEQGRVYHRNLEARIGDVLVKTQGSVGLDQSMDLLAEIPLQDKWLGDDKIFAGLKGQSLRIPVHGMLTRPDLDQRALAELGREMLGGTAERLLQDEIGKGLQKLLGPK